MASWCSWRRIGGAAAALLGMLVGAATAPAPAQGFPNVARTPGELLSGPNAIAPEQGRTAIIAWHGGRIVSVPEPPGSQDGADVQIRVVDLSDLSVFSTLTGEQLEAQGHVYRLRAGAGGFNSHGYFHSGPFLFVGPHCATESLGECPPFWEPGNVYSDSFLLADVADARPRLGTSSLVRASIETELGLPLGSINRSGAQSPWGAEMWWTYGDVEGLAWLAVRRSLGEWVYDWGNGGALTGPAIRAWWDHLGDTGVVGQPFIIGNILIYAADQTGTGVAAYDISDLENPVLLDVLKEENPGGYWPEVYGHYIFFPRRDGEGGPGSSAGYMVVDFSDPTNLRVVANRNVPGSNQYVTFQDEFAFMNNYKIDMRTFDVVLELDTSPAGFDASQFALPVGNLVVTGGYGTDGPGLRVWAHQAEPDTRGPFVAYHIPRPDQTNYSIHCPITLSIPETLRTETIVDGVSLIVRPVGGAPIPTWHAFGQNKLLTVTPRALLEPNTTYEVILTSAIEDAAGNGLEPYSFRFSTGGDLGGGNHPPVVGAIVVTPGVGEPGEEVGLAWSGSDADDDALEYRVDFGDGTPRTPWGPATTAQHTYPAAGHYQVTVQARDPHGAVGARSRTITIAVPPAAPGSTASGLMAHDAAGGRVFVANPDADTVTALDTTTLAPAWEVPVGAHPAGIARAADGALWVVCRDADLIDVLHPATGATLTSIPLPYGTRPVAVAATPDGATLLVSCEGTQALRRYDAGSRAQTGSVALGPWPRAIAVTADGTRALVTRFVSGEHVGQVYDVSLAGAMSLTRTISLTRDRSTDGSASGRGVPNYLAGVRIAPDGRWAWVVGKKDNTTRGTFFGANLALGQDSTVRAMLMLVDLEANAEDRTRRLDIDNSDSPSSVAFSALGDYAFIALQGNAQVAVIDVLDFMRQESPGTVRTRWGTGLAPQSVLSDAATGRLFTADLMGRSVTVVEAAPFLETGSANIGATQVAVVGEERMHPAVRRGKELFYHASDPRMSAEGYISCATCHIDGSHDGRTFDFTNRGEGFRNTTDLRGRSGTGHGAVHWSANFDEVHDFEHDIRGAFGGSGFLGDADFAATNHPLGAPKAGLSVDLDALAAYVTFLGPASLPRSPERTADGGLGEAALRGQALFAAHDCASCHAPGDDFTDRQMHDVGTLRASSGSRLGGALTGIDTPTLLGLHATAPYLHDGSAPTLGEVFTSTGGRLAQAETGARTGNVQVDTVTWHPLKEWHQGAFVVWYGPGTLTFDDVASSVGGPGYLEVRYNASYAQGMFNVALNGGTAIPVVVPQTPNQPSWMPNEWRRVRIPVTFAAGTNTVVFTGGSQGGELKLDDILFSTPDDAAAASAHVRGFTTEERADLVAYLRSLDGTNALRGGIAITRAGGGAVAPGGTDEVVVPDGVDEVALVYTIANPGSGPLNLGAVRLGAMTGGVVTVEREPAAHVGAGGATELELRVVPGVAGASAVVRAWSDVPGVGEVTWTVVVTRGSASVPGDFWVAY